MIRRLLLLLAVAPSCLGMTGLSGAPVEDFSAARRQALVSYRDDPEARAFSDRQAPTLEVLAHRALAHYSVPLAPADTEAVFRIDKRGRVEQVFVDQNSHLGALLRAESKRVHFERPPYSPFYLMMVLSTPGVG